MRLSPLAALGALTTLALSAVPAGAQDRTGYGRGEGLSVRVRPRSWLEPGNVVKPGSAGNPATSPQLIAASSLNIPPYGVGMRDRFGYSSLPDPVTNGPFAGARNVFGPVDYSAFDPPRY